MLGEQAGGRIMLETGDRGREKGNEGTSQTSVRRW